jgi:hypothetical protein
MLAGDTVSGPYVLGVARGAVYRTCDQPDNNEIAIGSLAAPSIQKPLLGY